MPKEKGYKKGQIVTPVDFGSKSAKIHKPPKQPGK